MGRKRRFGKFSKIKKRVDEWLAQSDGVEEEVVHHHYGSFIPLGGESGSASIEPTVIGGGNGFSFKPVKSCPVVKAAQGVVHIDKDVLAMIAHATDAEPIEWAVTLHGRRAENGLEVWIDDVNIPPQRRSGTEVDLNEEIVHKGNLVGILHSHHSMGTFFSMTDENELNRRFPISIVVAKYTTAGRSITIESSGFEESAWLGFAYYAVGQVMLPCGRTGVVEFKIVPSGEGTEDWPLQWEPKLAVTEEYGKSSIGDCPEQTLQFFGKYEAADTGSCGQKGLKRPMLRVLGSTPEITDGLPVGQSYVSSYKVEYGRYSTYSQGYGQYPSLIPQSTKDYKTPLELENERKEKLDTRKAEWPGMVWDLFDHERPVAKQNDPQRQLDVDEFIANRLENEKFFEYQNRMVLIRRWQRNQPMNIIQQNKLKSALYKMYRDPVNHETWSKFWERWNSEMGPLVFNEEKKEEKDA